jgi:hypothetical protein
MYVRRRVPFLKIVPMDAVLAKLGITKPQLEAKLLVNEPAESKRRDPI